MASLLGFNLDRDVFLKKFLPHSNNRAPYFINFVEMGFVEKPVDTDVHLYEHQTQVDVFQQERSVTHLNGVLHSLDFLLDRTLVLDRTPFGVLRYIQKK